MNDVDRHIFPPFHFSIGHVTTALFDYGWTKRHPQLDLPVSGYVFAV